MGALSSASDDGHRSRRAPEGAAARRIPARVKTRSGSLARRAAAPSCSSSWPATRASTATGRQRCADLRRDARDAARRAVSGGAPVRRDAGDLRPADGAAGHLRRLRHRRERQSLLATLRSTHFIRSSGSSERGRDVPRSDPRSGGRADGARHGQRLHALMVRTLVARGSDDCEALFEHYRGAGDVENASIQASRSAAKASAALAFDRAASFYRHALALTPASPSGPAWKEGLADALANAGRPAEAARAYVTPRRRPGIDTRRRAAAARRRAVPHRRRHRPGPRPAS